MNSILIYTAIIISVTFFIWLAEKQFGKNHKKVGMILAFIAILVASYFSGIRDSVGVDWLQFSTMFDQAHYINSFSDYMNHFDQIEKGYLALNYFLSKVILSKYVFMGLCTGITITFTFLALYLQRSKISLSFGMFLYMINFYLYDFNAIRQNMSVAIALLGISMMLNDIKFRKVILVFALGISIHYSSIIIILFLIFYSMEYNRIEFNGLLSRVIIFSLIICLIFSLKYLLIFVSSIGFGRYDFYSSLMDSENTGFNIALLLKGLVLLTIMTLNRKELNKLNPKNNSILYIMLILWTIFSQLSIIAPFISRINLLFEYSTILYIPQLSQLVIQKERYFLTKYILLCTFIFYWVYAYAFRNYSQVIPYTTIFNNTILR